MSLSYEQLIDKSIKAWTFREYAAHRRSLNKLVIPCITVSRDPGSGGRAIAKNVADKLGYEFYNSKLLEEIAESTKMRTSVLAQVDEKARTGMQDLLHAILDKNYISENKYISHLCKTIMSIYYSKGKVVFLGRGANYVIPSGFSLRVRITAPYDVRVIRAMEYEKISREEAKKSIKKITSDRSKFIKQYFGKNINKCSNYDLVLNTSYFSIDEATEIIIKAFHKKFPKGQIKLR